MSLEQFKNSNLLKITELEKDSNAPTQMPNFQEKFVMNVETGELLTQMKNVMT